MPPVFEDVALLQMRVGREVLVLVEVLAGDWADDVLVTELEQLAVTHDQQHVKHLLYDAINLQCGGGRLHVGIPVVVEPLLEERLATLILPLLLGFFEALRDLGLVLLGLFALGHNGR